MPLEECKSVSSARNVKLESMRAVVRGRRASRPVPGTTPGHDPRLSLIKHVPDLERERVHPENVRNVLLLSPDGTHTTHLLRHKENDAESISLRDVRPGFAKI